MAISLVASVQIPGSTSGGTSAAINTTGASLLVMSIAQSVGEAQIMPSDSLGNTWTALTKKWSASSGTCIYYVSNPNVGSAHTFTASDGPSTFCITQIAAFSGVS